MATTHAPMARVPFAPLDNPRLQHLASMKNRQNGMLAPKSSNLGKSSLSKNVFTLKRSYHDTAPFSDADGENVDPTTLTSPSKKSKSDVAFGTTSNSNFTFSLSPAQSMPAPSVPIFRTSTPARVTKPVSPRTPLTAPAGRSPKRKAANGRRISAPFTRVDPPPSFGARASSMLPFSLDAAISGSLSHANGPRTPSSTIQESMPSSWFFDIYEDTPEDIAANLMEHSTSILDLSSDEESAKKDRDNVGKENMPPEDYDGPTASRSTTAPCVVPQPAKKTDLIRTKILAADEMDDGLRSPLSDLDTDPFIPAGLDRDSHFVVVDATPDKLTAKLDLNELFATPVTFTAGSKAPTLAGQVNSSLNIPAHPHLKGEIVVCEDDDASSSSSTTDTAIAPKDVAIEQQDSVANEDTENVAQ